MSSFVSKSFSGIITSLFLCIVLSSCKSVERKAEEMKCPIKNIDKSYDFKRCFSNEFQKNRNFDELDIFLKQRGFSRKDDGALHQYRWEKCNVCTVNITIDVLEKNSQIEKIHIRGFDDGSDQR